MVDLGDCKEQPPMPAITVVCYLSRADTCKRHLTQLGGSRAPFPMLYYDIYDTGFNIQLKLCTRAIKNCGLYFII